MGQNLNINRTGILNQIKESYGKLVYTYTTHIKCASILSKRNEIIKWFLIGFTALSTGGLFTIIFADNSLLVEIITTIITTVTLALTTYQKSSSLESRIVSHIQIHKELWRLREEFLSFLTDFDYLSDERIIEKRDYLTARLGEVYSREPLTNSKAYKMAQKALKSEEEQFFTEEELNLLLPKHLRSE